jgi:MFS family permease
MNDVTGDRRKRGWYHGWNIVAVCILSQVAANSLPINAFSLFLHDWSAQLHVPVSSLELGIAACGLGCAFLAPVAGMLSDKYPARNVLAGGLAGLAVFCVSLSFVTKLWEYLALYALMLPLAMCCATTIPANAVVLRWFVRRVGLALGLTAAGLSMAGIVMPPIIAAVMPVLGWRVIWRIGGGLIAFVILPLVLVVIRERPAARDGKHYLSQDGAPAAQHLHASSAGDSGTLRWRDILSRRNFWLLAFGYLTMLALYGGCGNNLGPIATSRGLSTQTAGLLLSAYSLSQLVATLGAGMLSDRLGNRPPLVGLAFLTAAGGLLIAFGQSAVSIMLGALLAGVGGSFWPLLASALSKEFSGKGFGRAFGALIFMLPLAVLSPFAVAKVQENTGSYAPALVVMVAFSVTGGIACLFLHEKGGGKAAQAQGKEVKLKEELLF